MREWPIGSTSGRLFNAVRNAAIKANIKPATSILGIGQSLSETENWAAITDPLNYSTTADGAEISEVVVNYFGSTATASESLAAGNVNHFSITVRDNAGNPHTFDTTPRLVPVAVVPALEVTTQPTAAGLTGAVTDETHSEILARLTNTGQTTPAYTSITPTLVTSGGDPVAEGDTISGVDLVYSRDGYTDATATVDLAITVGAVVGDAALAFGEFTQVGEAGMPIEATDGDYGQFTVSAGTVTANTSPLTVGTFDVGGNSVSVVANERSVGTIAEGEAAIAAVDPAATTTIRFRDGTYTGNRLNLAAKVMTGRLTLACDTVRGAILPGLDALDTQNITSLGIHYHREWTSVADDADFVVRLTGPGHKFDLNEISSNDIATAVYGDPPEILQGIGSATSDPYDDLILTRNSFHDLSEGWRLIGANMTITGNYHLNCYANFGKLFSTVARPITNLVFTDNFGYGIWARSTGGTPIEVAEDPHSALFGMVSEVVEGGTVRGNVAFVGSNRVTQGDGIYGTARGWGWDDPSGSPAEFPDLQKYDNVQRDHNVWGINQGTALTKGFINSTFAHETYIVDPNTVEAGSAAGCAFNADLVNNTKYQFLAGPVVNILNQSTVDDSTINGSHAIVPVSADVTVAQLEEMYAGPFGVSDVTPENFQTRLAPVLNGPLTQWDRMVGALDTGYFTWATGVGTEDYTPSVYVPPAAYVKPATTLATGSPLQQVLFDAADFASANAAPFTGFSATGLTMQFGIGFVSDGNGTTQHITSSGADIRIRRLNDGEMQMRFDLANGTSFIIAPSRPQLAADGVVTYTIAADFANGKFMMMRGAVLEALANSHSGYQGSSNWVTSAATLVVGGSDSGAAGEDMIFTHLLMGDYVDLEVSGNQSLFIAQDGQPAPLGADGSTPFSAQPPIFLTGDKAAWNGGGLNLGGNGVSWNMNGLVEDVGGYTPTFFATNGTAWMLDDSIGKTESRYYEFFCRIVPQSVTGTSYLVHHRDGTLVGLADDSLSILIEDNLDAAVFSASSDPGTFVIGNTYDIYVGVDLGDPTANPVVPPKATVRINDALPAGIDESTIVSGSGLVHGDRQFGVCATRLGANKFNGHISDFWLGTTALQGPDVFFNGGTPPDLTGIGSPLIHVAGPGQTVANMNAFENLGSLVLSAGSATFTAV